MSEQEQEKPGKLKINGKAYEMPTDYKVSELRILKRFTDKALDEINWSDPDAIAAVVFILLRRENAAFTEAELDDVTVSVEEDDAASPPDEGSQETTPPADSGAQS